MVYFKKWENTQNGIHVGFYSWVGVKPSSVNARCGKTVWQRSWPWEVSFYLWLQITFKPKISDQSILLVLLLNGCVYVIAVHNVQRLFCYRGPARRKKNLKSYVLDDSFPARAGSGVENFPFFSTTENLKVAVSVKTQVCSAVSN